MREKGDIETLAKKFGLPSNMQSSLLARQGTACRNHQILDMFKKGLETDKIASRFEISVGTVRGVLRENGLGIKQLMKVEEARVAELVNAGYSDYYIAEKLGFTYGTAQAKRRKLGLPSNSRQIEVKKHVIELLKQGVKREELAKKFGYTKGTIDGFATKYKTFKYKTAQRDKQILELFNNGVPRKEIAKIVSVSYDTVLRTLRRFLGPNSGV